MLHISIHKKEAENVNEYTRECNIVEFVTYFCTSVGLYVSFELNLVAPELHILVICLPQLCNRNANEIGASGQLKQVHLLNLTSYIYILSVNNSIFKILIAKQKFKMVNV